MDTLLVKDSVLVQEKVRAVLASQRIFFQTGKTKSIDFRLEQLQCLKKMVKENEQAIFDALYSDLHKPPMEAYVTEVGYILEEIKHTIQHLRDWVRPESVPIPLTLIISSGYVSREPYGNTLIISPWNYPFQLLIAPLIGAIAGGNTAVLKPSEHAPATAALIAKLIIQYFNPEYIAVFEGDVQTNVILLEEKWDYIFFTGSTGVGRSVMLAAAKYLTPVTLELGGKSPCIIDKEVHLKYAAQRIVWGKYVNAGQTCVAPDYLLVHESIKTELVDLLKSSIREFFGDDPEKSPDYGRIINERHFNRLTAFLNDGIIAAGGKTNPESKFIAPTLLTDVDTQKPVMQEEIFGPILPILTYKNLSEAVAFVNSRPRPLALYVFTTNRQTEKYILANTSFGGGCVNDTLVHLGVPDLPFGGVGDSGMGAYHGKASFDSFTYPRSILRKSNLIDIKTRYAPYLNKLKILRWLMG